MKIFCYCRQFLLYFIFGAVCCCGNPQASTNKKSVTSGTEKADSGKQQTRFTDRKVLSQKKKDDNLVFGPCARVMRSDISPNGTLALISSWRGDITLYRVKPQKKTLFEFKVENVKRAPTISLSDDYGMFDTGSGVVKVFSTGNGLSDMKIEHGMDTVRVISTHGDMLMIGAESGECQVWKKTHDGYVFQQKDSFKFPILDAIFSNNRWLISVLNNGFWSLSETETQKLALPKDCKNIVSSSHFGNSVFFACYYQGLFKTTVSNGSSFNIAPVNSVEPLPITDIVTLQKKHLIASHSNGRFSELQISSDQMQSITHSAPIQGQEDIGCEFSTSVSCAHATANCLVSSSNGTVYLWDRDENSFEAIVEHEASQSTPQ